MTGVANILEWARQQVNARVPKADLDQRDPDYIRDQLPGVWMLASLYFRADVRGLDRIPAHGPVLLVGNHSGGNVPGHLRVHAGVLFLLRCRAAVLPTRAQPCRHLPGAGLAAQVRHRGRQPRQRPAGLKSGAAVLVYPGGDYEVCRPSWQRHVVNYGGRKGFVRLAREAAVPIVPVASVGGRRRRCSSAAASG